MLRTRRNIGPKIAGWLEEASIRSREDLIRIGTIDTCRRMRRAGHPVSLLAAYALEGALMDVHWNAIPVSFKRQLAIDFKHMIREEDSEAAVSRERASSKRTRA